MKFQGYVLGFVSTLLTITPAFTNAVFAQCVQGDVGIQSTFSEKPAQQTSNANMQSDPKCSGNASVTSGVQTNVGGNNNVQRREVTHTMLGGSGNSTGINSTTHQQSTVIQFNAKTPTGYPNR